MNDQTSDEVVARQYALELEGASPNHPDRYAEILLTAIRKAKEPLQLEVNRLSEICDALLNHCDKESGECSECGKIVCPHKDPMHFHHDGCPSCCVEEQKALHPTPTKEEEKR